jgi:hypothetical protein
MLKRKAQSSMEYSALVIIVMAALLTIGNYFKRGIQGRWKSSVDGMGDQYDPLKTNADIIYQVRTNVVTTLSTVNVVGGIRTFRNDVTSSIETKDGYSRVDAF